VEGLLTLAPCSSHHRRMPEPVVMAAASRLVLPVWDRLQNWLRRAAIGADFENREPWRRLANIVEADGQPIASPIAGTPFRPFGLFFRIRVTNPGRSTAVKVSGRLTDVLLSGGQRDQRVDSLNLHWVGSSDEEVNIRSGEARLLDVFYFKWNAAVLFDDLDQSFHLYPSVRTPMGIHLGHAVAGQTLRMKVSAEGVKGRWVELQLPGAALFGPQFLTVKHRSFSDHQPPGDWLEVPAPSDIAGELVPSERPGPLAAAPQIASNSLVPPAG